ncbi:hypothetical protein LCGC14_1242770 [marine sediment metagenome]|uniref:Uncharacterized protein n=1 Tax=marine sediment metagenome TaxID=412755 RepID=A0A0F9NMI8_9ZZZZ
MAVEKKRPVKRVKRQPTDKVLKEMRVQTSLLKDIKEILDNTWRERRPT